jgi:acetyl-CoA carboxylase carboxyltransferase component
MTLALLACPRMGERPDERLTPLERLEALADPGTLQLLRTQVRSRRMGERAQPGDGVLAGHARVPVIGFVESAGARMQEGLAALSGYGAIFREHVRLSGLVPQISIVCGPAAGGSSYGPALNDFVIMTGRASMFLTGPAVVAEVMGEDVDMAALGGQRVHERNGVCHFSVPTEVDGALLARELLEYLPQHAGAAPPERASVEAPEGAPSAG